MSERQTPDFELIQHLDWTQEELGELRSRYFADKVIWPAINVLASREGFGKRFVDVKNLGEELELGPLAIETSDVEELVHLKILKILASCSDEGSDPDSFRPVGTVDIGISERIVEAESYLLPKESELQIWKKRYYFFSASQSDDPVYIEKHFLFMDFEGYVVQDLSKSQKAALEYLERDLDRDSWELKRNDCLDIVNVFHEFDIPPGYIDHKMRRFDEVCGFSTPVR